MTRGGLLSKPGVGDGTPADLGDSFSRTYWNKLEERGVDVFMVSELPRFAPGLFRDAGGGRVRRAPRRGWMLLAPVLVFLLGATASGQGQQGETIVFTHAPDGGPPLPVEDIYSMSGDGTQLKALTNDGRSYGPAWSPDGRRIVFIHDSGPRTKPAYGEKKGFETYHSVELCVMDRDGGNRHTVRRMASVIDGVAWSPDGKTFAISGVPDSLENLPGTRTEPIRFQLFLVPADGSGEPRLLIPNASTQAWSPDGKKLAFSVEQPRAQWAVHTANADGSNDIRLTDPLLDGGSPAWSPDGRRIAFDEFVDARGREQIFLMNADGSGRRQITSDPDWSCTHSSWSPDGNRLAFSCRSASAPCGGVSSAGTVLPECTRRIFSVSLVDPHARPVQLGTSDGISPAFAPISSDSAAFGVFKRADAGLAHFGVLARAGVTEELDLVIAIGSPKASPLEQTSWTMWSEDRKIGLFLQEKTRPERVYSLGSKSGFRDCAARVERVTATDSVISCEGDKSERFPNQKWVYDVRAKKLLGQFSYRPFAMYRCFQGAGSAVLVGSDTQRLIAVEYRADREPAFRVLGEAEARPWIGRVRTSIGTEGMEERRVIYIENDNAPPPVGVPALPRTTVDHLAAARPEYASSAAVAQAFEIDDSIGPWQREDGRIWFGKSFYDGEGSTGVGGFGYFNTKERRFHIFEPHEIADSSVSAIYVEPDAAWMALAKYGEYGGESGGLLRYDRQSGALRRIEFPDIAVRLIRVGGKLVAATNFGAAVVEGDGVKRYFVDRTNDGRLRMALATR